jgi:hypothetical protein
MKRIKLGLYRPQLPSPSRVQAGADVYLSLLSVKRACIKPSPAEKRVMAVLHRPFPHTIISHASLQHPFRWPVIEFCGICPGPDPGQSSRRCLRLTPMPLVGIRV